MQTMFTVEDYLVIGLRRWHMCAIVNAVINCCLYNVKFISALEFVITGLRMSGQRVSGPLSGVIFQRFAWKC